MKQIFTLILCLFFLVGIGQEFKKKSDFCNTRSCVIGKAKFTGQFYKKDSVFVSSRGSYFFVKKSKNNNWYKVYLEK